MSLPQLAIFDMDGLMIDSERLSRKCWREAGDAFGLTFTDEFLSSITGTAICYCKKKLIQEYGLDHAGADTFFTLKNRLADEYIAKNGMPAKKGLFELLDFLDENRVTSVVATSTQRARAKIHLESAGALCRMVGMICGDEVENSKPNPEIFLKCLERWDCPAQRAIVLEDSKNGLLAAASAGIRCVLVPDLQQPDAESERLAWYIASDLADVVKVLTPAESDSGVTR
ncbi:MAG: HAD family phosphatase [Defluviitaleaceae bacterium]|nr:HAD family phosphatase [Defluviitaleaceae bacterium]